MMKKYFMLMAVCGLLSVAMACGGDDEVEVPEVPAPRFVSVSPANGATDVPVGDVGITVEYDQNVSFVRSNISLIQITGGNISSARASGKTLLMTAHCPTEGTTVSVTIPSGVVINTQQKPADAVAFSFTTHQTPEPPAPVDDGYESASQAVLNMGPGWNLGNTLDSWGTWKANNLAPAEYETMWGQPTTDAHLMRAFKEKGFGAIRVPVTWTQHLDADNNVDKAWMDRVEEVVNYVLDAGMYCILNVHHDTGAAGSNGTPWLRADMASFDETVVKYNKLWEQIATRFRDYDHHLLFEGYNEMLDAKSSWNFPADLKDLQAVNGFAQNFVNTVRATGGNNAQRNLVVTTYAAAHGGNWGNAMNVLTDFVVPTDPCGNQSHLAVEVHSYDPYDWLHTYNYTWTAECRAALVEMFGLLNTYFISRGYPVIIGEYATNGAGEATIGPGDSVTRKAEAGKQAGDMTRLCKRYGAAGFYWMSLVDGKDRSEATFKWTMEQVADSIVNAYRQ